MKINRKIFIFFLLISLGILVVFILRSNNRNDIDKIPYEGTSEDYTNQVVMFDNKESRDLFSKLGGAIRYNGIKHDLYIFAQKSYEPYREKNKIIGFKISSNVVQDGDNISFVGRYGANKNKVAVTIKKLPNTRIKSSITDQTKNINIDNQLPSNAKRNQVIAELPIKSQAFYISYDDTGDSFIININRGGQKELEQALNELSTRLGIPDIGNQKYSIVRTAEGGILSPVPLVDNKAGDFYE